MNKKYPFYKSLAFKLFISYGILFLASAVIIYFLTIATLRKSLELRLDAELNEEIHELAVPLEKGGLELLKKAFTLEAESEDSKELFFQLLSPSEELIDSSDLSDWKGIDLSVLTHNRPAMGSTTPNYRVVFDVLRNHHVRIAQKRIGEGYIVVMGHHMAGDENLINAYRERFGMVVIVMFFVIAVVMWFIGQRSIRGIQIVTEVANKIRQGNLHAHVDLKNESAEITVLAETFNAMSVRIESLIQEMRDVTNNIAHDLRTPVTRMRGTAETTLSGPRDFDSYEEALGIVIDEADNLKNMISTLLEIAEVDSGISRLTKTKLNLRLLLEEAYELFLPLAALKKINLTINKGNEDLFILGNVQQVQRVISNLIDNAIKYTDGGGSVKIESAVKGNDIEFIMGDSGVGISQEEQDNIFKPFYRCDESRSTTGNGLGLSFVRAVVESMNGKVIVDSQLGSGSSFLVSIPQSK